MSQFAIGDAEWPRISKLVEEMGEVGQVIGKLMGSRGEVNHWDGTNLRDRLIEEVADLLAATDFVIAHNFPDAKAIETRRKKKLETFERWHSEHGK